MQGVGSMPSQTGSHMRMFMARSLYMCIYIYVCIYIYIYTYTHILLKKANYFEEKSVTSTQGVSKARTSYFVLRTCCRSFAENHGDLRTRRLRAKAAQKHLKIVVVVVVVVVVIITVIV